MRLFKKCFNCDRIIYFPFSNKNHGVKKKIWLHEKCGKRLDRCLFCFFNSSNIKHSYLITNMLNNSENPYFCGLHEKKIWAINHKNCNSLKQFVYMDTISLIYKDLETNQLNEMLLVSDSNKKVLLKN